MHFAYGRFACSPPPPPPKKKGRRKRETNTLAGKCFAGRDLGEGGDGGAVQVEDADGGVVHGDVDSMDLSLLVGIHFRIGGCNAVPDKCQLSSFVPPFPVHPEEWRATRVHFQMFDRVRRPVLRGLINDFLHLR